MFLLCIKITIMKKLLIILLVSFSFLKCQNDVKISEKLSDDVVYTYQAKYPDNKTDKVRSVVTKHLNDHGFSLDNTDVDAEVVLDNGAHFNIKSKSGSFKITFDVSKNSEENYTMMKEMCKEISTIFS